MIFRSINAGHGSTPRIDGFFEPIDQSVVCKQERIMILKKQKQTKHTSLHLKAGLMSFLLVVLVWYGYIQKKQNTANSYIFCKSSLQVLVEVVLFDKKKKLLSLVLINFF